MVCSGVLGGGRRSDLLGGVDDDAIHKDQGGKKGTHTVQSGHFPLIFDADGVTVGRHPSAAAGDRVGGVGTIRG